MGHIIQPTPAMGPFRVEGRRESFYFSGEDNYDWSRPDPSTPVCVDRRHALWIYPTCDGVRQGTVEALYEDIPALTAVLASAQAYHAGGHRGDPRPMLRPVIVDGADLGTLLLLLRRVAPDFSFASGAEFDALGRLEAADEGVSGG